MSEVSLEPETVPMWGETLCLDFANTVSWSDAGEHVDPERTEVIRTTDMLDRWGRRQGLLPGDAGPPSGAELRRARLLRDTVHRVFVSIGSLGQPLADDMALLMRTYSEAVDAATLAEVDHGFMFEWRAHDTRRIRYAVATDAVDLLRDPDRLGRVTHCPGRDCGWLFLNTSGRRRWCSMSTCGSREKMRRLHQRQVQRARN